MSGHSEMAERHGRVLVELVELGLTVARDLAARVPAAEAAREAAELANALHRVSRSVRQSLALEARLERDARRLAREDVAEAERGRRARVETAKARVRAAVERLIWTEAEDDEAERLLDELDDRLEEEALDDGFANVPAEAHIERIRKDLGLDPPPARSARGRWPNPPPPGADREATGAAGSRATRWGPEGGETHAPVRLAPQSPHPLRGSSPSGGASDLPDPPP